MHQEAEAPDPLTSGRVRAQRQRRPRMDAQRIEQELFAAARELVYAQGVVISLEDLSFEEVIQKANVARSSAYRLFPYKGDFVEALLCDLAGPGWAGTAAFDEATIDRAKQIVLENAERLADKGGRRQVLMQTVRECAAMNFEAIVKSREWHIYVSLVATARATGGDPGRLRIVAALEHSEMTFIDRMAAFYDDMMSALGLRFKSSDYTARHVAAAGASIVEGLALRRVLTLASRDAKVPDHGWKLDQLVMSELSPPADSEVSEPWSLAALAFLGVLDALVEPF